MEQNNIWTRFIVIGGLISITLFTNACTKDYEQTAEFIIINATNSKIDFGDKLKGYNMAPRQTYRSTVIMDGNRNMNESSFKSPLYMAGPITIEFDNKRCLILQTIESENSIFNIKNFVVEKSGFGSYKFTYTFTEADYNRAVACP